MNLVGLRFNDNGVRGYSHLIVRRDIGNGFYEVEWFDMNGESRGTNNSWNYEALFDWGGVSLDETYMVEQLLKDYELHK
jgi:hypothetical protein